MRLHRKILKHLEQHGLDPNIEYVASESGELVPKFSQEETKASFQPTSENFDESSKFVVPDIAKTVVESLQTSEDSVSLSADQKQTSKRKPPPPRKKKVVSETTD